MNGTKFSEAFRQRATGRYHPDTGKVARFDSAHKWSDTFSELTHDVLEGKDPTVDTSVNLIQTYMQWAQVDFSELIEESMDIENEFDAQYASKLNFHILNISAITLWKHILVDRRTSMSPNLVRTVQNNLAAQAVDYMRIREFDIENGDFLSSDIALRRNTYLGILNEIDTAIVAQEVSLKNPGVFVLPAASQFESSTRHERNSDLLAIDMKKSGDGGERQVRGIQAKLSVDQEVADNTDPDYVTLVDGIMDLGSTKRIRPQAHRSAEIVKPWPGLIAAHHLLSTKNISIIPNAAKANIRKSGNKTVTRQAMQFTIEAQNRKYEASKHAAGTKSNNKRAAQIVVSRVLSDLYR